MDRSRRVFTLVELLVVVATIAVLISLLTPALEDAVYQAELTVCGARHRALGSAVTTYATDSRRWYPYRSAVHAGNVAAWPAAVSNGTITEDEVAGLATGEGYAAYDDRPRLRPYLSLNGTLNCPLAPTVDIDGSKRDTIVRTAMDLWFGWKYRGYAGMNRLGDDWQWNDSDTEQRFSLLSGTPLVIHKNGTTATSSHFDREGTYSVNVLQDGYSSETAAEYNHRNYSTLNMTLTQWVSNDTQRGPVDLNHGYADLSVRRTSAALWQGDSRLSRVARFSTGKDWPEYHHLAPQR
jgi:type II secretory pathway pseudopilin PulG